MDRGARIHKILAEGLKAARVEVVDEFRGLGERRLLVLVQQLWNGPRFVDLLAREQFVEDQTE